MVDIVRPFEYRSLLKRQCGAGLEEKGSCEECALRHYDLAATFQRSLVNDFLDCFCLEPCRVVSDALIGYDVVVGAKR